MLTVRLFFLSVSTPANQIRGLPWQRVFLVPVACRYNDRASTPAMCICAPGILGARVNNLPALHMNKSIRPTASQMTVKRIAES